VITLRPVQQRQPGIGAHQHAGPGTAGSQRARMRRSIPWRLCASIRRSAIRAERQQRGPAGLIRKVSEKLRSPCLRSGSRYFQRETILVGTIARPANHRKHDQQRITSKGGDANANSGPCFAAMMAQREIWPEFSMRFFWCSRRIHRSSRDRGPLEQREPAAHFAMKGPSVYPPARMLATTTGIRSGPLLLAFFRRPLAQLQRRETGVTTPVCERLRVRRS